MRALAATLVAFLALISPCAAFTVTSLGTSSNASGATLTLTGVNVTAGHTIWVCVVENTGSGGGAAAISDGTNTYTIGATLKKQFNGASGTTGFQTCGYVLNSATLTSATITATKFGTGQTAMTAVDIGGTNNTNETPVSATGSSTTPASGSLTPSNSADLFVGCAGTVGNSGTFTQASGFGTPPNEATSGTTSNDVRVDCGNLTDSGTTAHNYNPSFTVTSQWAAMLIAFPPPASAAPPQRTLIGVGQ